MTTSPGFVAVKTLVAGAFAAAAKKSGGRATHKTGVGGRGSLVLAPVLDLPPHRELRPGRQLDATLRHANLNLDDDLAADFRGAALQLSVGGRHVLDLPMNTGRTTVWRTAAHFAERMQLFARGRLAEFYERHPDALDRFWDGQRRAPERYDDLRYTSKIGLRYLALDGSVHAARFRLLPADDRPETGLPTDRDRAAGPLETARWPEESRPENSVRERFLEDLRRGPLHYSLEVQVRPALDDPSDPVHDPTLPWDRPWTPLGALILTEALPPAELEPLRIHFGRGPATLRPFGADSEHDLTSIGALRAFVYPLAARARG
jgi:arachidonate 5-lipoxygenase